MKFKGLIMIFLLILIFGRVSAMEEVEPNDSMDTPQVIGEGIVSGEINDQTSDIFRVDVPNDNLTFFSLKKTDTNRTSLHLEVFDSSREHLFGTNAYNYGGGINVAGEKISHIWEPSEEPDSFFMVITGRGTYDIDVKFQEIDDPNDAPGLGDLPWMLEDGDHVAGSVYEFEHGSDIYADQDNFRFEVNTDTIIRVKITKEDMGAGSIHARLYHAGEGEHTELDDIGQSDTLEYEVMIDTYEDSETVYLDIWGEGDYEIDITYEDTAFDPAIMIGLMGAMICIAMMISFMPVFIIIIVIILLVRGSSKTKKKNRRKLKKGRKSHS